MYYYRERKKENVSIHDKYMIIIIILLLSNTAGERTTKPNQHGTYFHIVIHIQCIVNVHLIAIITFITDTHVIIIVIIVIIHTSSALPRPCNVASLSSLI
jgi:hypothetical protein